MLLINMEFEDRFALNFTIAFGRRPRHRELKGARRIADQLVKFWVQFNLGRDVKRCRQIIFGNIPMICMKHGLDFQFVKICFEQVICGRGIEAQMFLELVYEYHRQAPEAVVPSRVLGCAIPLVVALISSVLFLGVASGYAE
jgi:hypothetical protein